MEKKGRNKMIKAQPQQQQLSSMITVDLDPEALHCPKCLNPLAPPVFQCAAGHALCSSCHAELPDKAKCESCFVKTGYGYSRCCFVPTKYTRCLAMERVLRSIRVACRNGAAGCAAAGIMSYHEKAEHDKTCPGAGLGARAGPSFLEMGPCGGAGSPWKMDARRVSRIVNVVVRHGSAVDALCVWYELDDDDGIQKVEQSNRGGPGGRSSQIGFEPGAYLTCVKGRLGNQEKWFVVKSLTFVTNRGRTHGPYGEEHGVPFELPAPAGGRIVGFHGRSGSLLDAIGTYVRMD